MTPTSSALLEAAAKLRDDVERLRFGPPVSYVYDPLVYAWSAHATWIERYGDTPKEIVLVGMNPGPFGMAQTGVPFGEVTMVTTWLGIGPPDVVVGKPPREHPKRPVLGFQCARSEVSGARLWGAIAKKHKDPRAFFRRCFVINFCPLLFLAASGANLTPDKIVAAERAPLEAACRSHLASALAVLQPRTVIGVGAYAAKQAKAVLDARTGDAANRATAWGVLPHPSPASPAANAGWAALARAALQKMRIAPFL